MNLKLIVPIGVLVIGGLAGCSSDAPPATAPAGNAVAAPTTSPATGEKGEEKVVEEPLKGSLKRKAEKAALKEYPGDVLKSEHDEERPGLYAVEIRQKSGEEVEVYLDTDFNVVGTKDESGDSDDD